MDWTTWVPTVILGIALFLSRNWIKYSIERSVQHKFDEKLQNLQSDLRSKEHQLTALREAVLSGRASRQQLLDQRRLEAVERVWKSVMELAPYKVLSALLVSVNLDIAEKEAARDPKVRELFEILGRSISSSDKVPENSAINEKPFISPIAWAYFSAYQTILAGAFAQYKALEIGIENPRQFIDTDSVKKVLKTTLPHLSDFVEKHDSTAYHYLLNELEERLLEELRAMLEGADVDETSLKRSAEIMKVIEETKSEGVLGGGAES